MEGLAWENAVSFQKLLKSAEQRLKEAGIEDAGTDAWYLMEAAFDIDRTWYYLHAMDMAADAEKIKKFCDWIEKRAAGFPVQQLIGRASFMGFAADAGKLTWIPNESQGLKLPNRTCLKVGTGSVGLSAFIAEYAVLQSANA